MCDGFYLIIWICTIGIQNPGYMKENFIICIESLHLGDVGDKSNVSNFYIEDIQHYQIFISLCYLHTHINYL
jgi:hypothetical protein